MCVPDMKFKRNHKRSQYFSLTDQQKCFILFHICIHISIKHRLISSSKLIDIVGSKTNHLPLKNTLDNFYFKGLWYKS